MASAKFELVLTPKFKRAFRYDLTIKGREL